MLMNWNQRYGLKSYLTHISAFGFFEICATLLAETLRMTIVDRSHPGPEDLAAARSSCLIETAMRLKHLP
jgi:hypothetical protein